MGEQPECNVLAWREGPEHSCQGLCSIPETESVVCVEGEEDANTAARGFCRLHGSLSSIGEQVIHRKPKPSTRTENSSQAFPPTCDPVLGTAIDRTTKLLAPGFCPTGSVAFLMDFYT